MQFAWTLQQNGINIKTFKAVFIYKKHLFLGTPGPPSLSFLLPQLPLSWDLLNIHFITTDYTCLNIFQSTLNIVPHLIL